MIRPPDSKLMMLQTLKKVANFDQIPQNLQLANMRTEQTCEENVQTRRSVSDKSSISEMTPCKDSSE